MLTNTDTNTLKSKYCTINKALHIARKFNGKYHQDVINFYSNKLLAQRPGTIGHDIVNDYLYYLNGSHMQ